MPALERRPAQLAPWPPTALTDPKGRTNTSVIVGDDRKQSFVTIASNANVDVWDLIEYNFRTRDPKEVNWYLREYLGCFNLDGTGNNYTFFGAGTRGDVGDASKVRGAIYVPRAPGPKPPPVPGVPEDLTPLDSIELEFDVVKDKPFKLGRHFVGKFSLSGRVSATLYSDQTNAKVKWKPGKEIALVVAEKLGEDVEVSAGAKIGDKLRDAWKKDPKNFKEELRSSFEIGLKHKGITGAAVEVALNASTTPVVVKVHLLEGLKLSKFGPYDLSEQLAPILGPGKHVVTIKGKVVLTFKFDPSPELATRILLLLGAPGIVLGGTAAWLAFVDYAMKRSREKQLNKARALTYVRAYLRAIFDPEKGPETINHFAPDREEMVRVQQLASERAQKLADELAAPLMGEAARRAYRAFLMSSVRLNAVEADGLVERRARDAMRQHLIANIQAETGIEADLRWVQ